MTTNKRNSLLINRSFQLRLIIKFVILNIIIMTLFGILMYLFLNSEVESNFRSAHVTYQNLNDMLFPIILTLSIVNILFSSLIIAVFILVASHRIAGPQYRFLETLENIQERNLTTSTTIRGKDQFQQSSEALIRAESTIRKDLLDMKVVIEKMKKVPPGTNPEGFSELLKNLGNTIEKYTL